MTQGTLTLRADRVFVRQDAEGFNHAIAFGRPVAFKQKREGTDEYIEGFAERMEYDGKQDKVQLFTNAHVKKGIDEVKGDYISYDAVTEYYQVIGGGPDTASPANPRGRVRAVIQPKRRDGESGGPGRRDGVPGTSAPVPLQPSPGVGSR
jgi:lipopolysaccharide export system protein LptA